MAVVVFSKMVDSEMLTDVRADDPKGLAPTAEGCRAHENMPMERRRRSTAAT